MDNLVFVISFWAHSIAGYGGVNVLRGELPWLHYSDIGHYISQVICYKQPINLQEKRRVACLVLLTCHLVGASGLTDLVRKDSVMIQIQSQHKYT